MRACRIVRILLEHVSYSSKFSWCLAVKIWMNIRSGKLQSYFAYGCFHKNLRHLEVTIPCSQYDNVLVYSLILHCLVNAPSFRSLIFGCSMREMEQITQKINLVK